MPHTLTAIHSYGSPDPSQVRHGDPQIPPPVPKKPEKRKRDDLLQASVKELTPLRLFH